MLLHSPESLAVPLGAPAASLRSEAQTPSDPFVFASVSGKADGTTLMGEAGGEEGKKGLTYLDGGRPRPPGLGVKAVRCFRQASELTPA